MADVNVQILVDYPEQDGYPAFTDAIYVPLSEYERMSEAQIEALRRERYDARNAIIDNPPEPEPVTPAEGEPSQLQQLREQTQALLDQLNAAIAQETSAAEA